VREYRKGFEMGLSAGMTLERKRIIALLRAEAGPHFAGYKGRESIIELIKGGSLEKLRRLAEATGEYEDLSNPLIKGENE